VIVTTQAAVVGAGGTVDVLASAAVAGAAGNQSANTPATVDSPPIGIANTALVLSMTGGADVESAAELLERLLLDMVEIAQGGNDVDYKRWALGVPGVSRAYVFPVRRGLGTVDVVPLPPTGLPDAPLLASVQAVLDAKRPAGMLPAYGVLALAPAAISTPVTATVAVGAGYTLAGVTPALNAAIAAVFSELGPGDTLVRTRLSSVTSTLLQLVTQGTTTLT
jgi:uncharacterized phage protein gp47/JayE